MKILAIYKQFGIYQGLAEHMLRVAAVAKQIGDSSPESFAVDSVVKAALVHDLGNIMKTKFEMGSDMFEPEGVEYYRTVQAEVAIKYGDDSTVATSNMIKELNLSAEVITLTEATGGKAYQRVAVEGDLNEKLMMYADMRVSPFAVTSLKERFDDLETRAVPARYTLEAMTEWREVLNTFEEEIFSDLTIQPEDINDQSCAAIIEELQNYEV